MRCKKHPSDLTSTVGVCASCLRERLTAIIEAQTRAQAQLQIQAQLSRLHSCTEEPPKSDPNPPPLVFPRSVSPYVSRRKSDDSTWPHQNSRSDHNHNQQQRHHIRFYSTPQVGPTYDATTTIGGSYKKSKPKFSLMSLFRSRSDKFWMDPRVASRDSMLTSASSASPSWFSTIFAGKRGKQSKQLYADDSSVRVRSRHRMARGMSPDITPDAGGGFGDDCDRSASGSGDSPASSTPDWKKTPVQATPSRRTRSGPGKNVSGLTFCLSPLVRANPNPHWNQKGFPPDLGITGEIRVATKPHLSTAASFCKNRSRKLADFGRAPSNR